MASFLQAENLSKSYGDRVLFRNISFNINEGDKIALIAPNGTGKSSLLKILAGVDSSDRGGEVRFMRDLRVAFLDQHTDFDPERTLFDEVYSRLGETGRIISEYERAIVSEDRGRIERAMAAMDAAACWNAEQRVRQVLSSLQLTRLDQKMGQLSGGEAKRAAIASMLLQEADFLVMDEPTNHLDIDVIEFLEGYLQKSRCTLLMVTHDRYFLDRVCNTIFELDRGNLYTYRGNYSYFLEKRDERYRNMQADIDKSRNLLRRELEWIRSTPQARTGKARYRINAFYDLKQKASVSLAQQSMSINVAPSRLGGKIIDCEDVSLHFGQRCMLDDFSYKFSRYERVGIVGKNGVGKSTFLNLLTGAIAPDAGTIERGETLRIGYYRQQGMSFRAGQTVFDVVQEIAETATTADGHTVSAMSMLNRFLFPPETHAKHIEVLSGGERRRLYLLTILMRNPNFLILDEPTNDLDIMTLNVLEDYLSTFKGCLLIVSHDRYFLDKTVDHLFVMQEGGTEMGIRHRCTRAAGRAGARGTCRRREGPQGGRGTEGGAAARTAGTAAQAIIQGAARVGADRGRTFGSGEGEERYRDCAGQRYPRPRRAGEALDTYGRDTGAYRYTRDTLVRTQRYMTKGNDTASSAAATLFRTVVQIPPMHTRIGYGDTLLSLGSCFADNMARRMQRAKFRITASPTGILFNPESVARAIEAFDAFDTDKEQDGNTVLPPQVRDVECDSVRYFSYDFHSAFSAADAATARANMAKGLRAGAEALTKAGTIIITFGTAWVYRLRRDGRVVANCHKQPQALFERTLLTAEQIAARYDALFDGPLQGKNVIFTVSPVRHLGDGLTGNALSKSLLRVAVEQICQRHPKAEYFPSFEILNDELRDYRFYADDMTHPSDVAVDYIWQRFAEAAFDSPTRRAAEDAQRIVQAAEHRPFAPDSEQYRTFCRTMTNRIEALEAQYPTMDFADEKEYFASHIG